ncbi:GDSL esterase/lipase At4g28780 [Linum perenne]
MYQQLDMFLEYKHKVEALVGPAKAQELVSRAVFLVTCGGNDFVNNYFLTPVAPRRAQFTLKDYCGYVISHYKKILLALYGLNRDVGTDIFISANAFSLKMDMIEKPQLYGFKTSKVACCGQGLYNGVGMCTEMSNLCANRDDYVFWDPYHPTEKALRLMVQKLKNTTSLDHIRPMNLNTMMAVDAITMTMNP